MEDKELRRHFDTIKILMILMINQRLSSQSYEEISNFRLENCLPKERLIRQLETKV